MAPIPRTILVIGSLNIDLTTRTRRLPNPGETIAAQTFSTAPGGKGANQAVACCRLARASSDAPLDNILVKMVGAVGDDEFGGRLKDALRQNRIDVEGVVVKGGVSSGVAVIIVDEDTAENRILYTAGANEALTAQDFPENFFSSFTPLPSFLVLQLETPLQTVLHLLTLASNAGVETVLNPAPARHIPLQFYSKIDHLILNESEAAYLTGEEVTFLDDDDGVKLTIDRFLERGVKRSVVITMGARGCYFKSPDRQEGWIRPEVRAQDVVDTTGAGDAFVGAFAVARVEGNDVGQSLNFATRAASIKVQNMGAQAGIPWRGEVQ
ncbi:unnamed protein product [Tuber melanosporum]|uniref:Ribokinase n=1 Tax=Tuber melanosporum (strain Mel28) TaxID=656061 RepID=D5G5Z3_TUBMM|nr:uncharacterized protein GSTUM_00001691001 [Tuber melanosporum]CAZ79936.1 unnamed protein product [Tuber melanosporum]